MQDTDELFDVVDNQDAVVGCAPRHLCHSRVDFTHRAIFVVVFNKQGDIFLQQRSATKDTYPLRWTVSVSGHVSSGESYDEAMKRECLEEIGIVVSDWKELGKFLWFYPHETEFSRVYTTEHDGPFILDLSEIVEGRFFSLDTISQLRLEQPTFFTPSALRCFALLGF
ncbi:MAG: NUDIX domain-containing protein [bacterium]